MIKYLDTLTGYTIGLMNSHIAEKTQGYRASPFPKISELGTGSSSVRIG